MPPEEIRQDYKDVIRRLSATMWGLGTGPLAELRRMEIGGPGEITFWRLAQECGFIGDVEKARTWMQIVKIMAILTTKGERGKRELHDAKYRLGAALCDGGNPDRRVDGGEPRPFLSETRLARFLSLPSGQRPETLERMARALANSRSPERGINCVQIAALLLFPEESRNLQDLARDYYQTLDSAARKASQEETAA